MYALNLRYFLFALCLCTHAKHPATTEMCNKYCDSSGNKEICVYIYKYLNVIYFSVDRR